MSPREVPMLDLRRGGPELDRELEEAFRRVLRSGHYVMGCEVEELEAECAALLGARHALGVSSGTDALLLSLMTLGVGTGDEVICPTYTFFATAGSISRVGARPVFVDVRPCCFGIDPEALHRRMSKQVRAIVPVHLFGQCADLGAVAEVARDAGVRVIEDAAQAIGARCREGLAGTVGDFGCFSFFPSKNLGAMGDAGLLTVRDDSLAERAGILRSHGAKPKYHHALVGGNFRIDAVQAALLRVKLPRLAAATAARKRNADLYRKLLLAADVAAVAPSVCRGEAEDAPTCALSRHIVLPALCRDDHIYNQLVLWVRGDGDGGRDALRAYLRDHRIGSEVYYPIPMHLQECFRSLGHTVGDFPVAEAAANETLAVPIFPELTDVEIRYVCDRIIDWCRGS